MVESFSQSSRVELSVSSQYGRKPKTSRLSPPGSTAAARSACHAPGSGLGRSAGPTAAEGFAGATREAGPPSRIALPDSRPAGSAVGAPPPTTHRSALRGLNGTVTRAPGAKAILSAAWAIACSYWTVGCMRASAACVRGPAARTLAAGAIPTTSRTAAASAITRGRAAPLERVWRRADIDTRSLRVRGNAQPRVQHAVGLGLEGPGP